METIIVSACLLGENTKYNGGNNYDLNLLVDLKFQGNQVKFVALLLFQKAEKMLQTTLTKVLIKSSILLTLCTLKKPF